MRICSGLFREKRCVAACTSLARWDGTRFKIACNPTFKLCASRPVVTESRSRLPVWLSYPSTQNRGMSCQRHGRSHRTGQLRGISFKVFLAWLPCSFSAADSLSFVWPGLVRFCNLPTRLGQILGHLLSLEQGSEVQLEGCFCLPGIHWRQLFGSSPPCGL